MVDCYVLALFDSLPHLQLDEQQGCAAETEQQESPRGTAEAGGIRLADFPGQIIPSPVALANGAAVTVGIRPEHFHAQGSASLDVTVEIIEHLGGETYAYARDLGTELITIATDNNRTLAAGDRYAAKFDPATLLIFDEAGRRLR